MVDHGFAEAMFADGLLTPPYAHDAENRILRGHLPGRLRLTAPAASYAAVYVGRFRAHHVTRVMSKVLNCAFLCEAMPATATLPSHVFCCLLINVPLRPRARRP
jgi:hypothetical protein